MSYIGAFIALAIFFGIGTLILGGTSVNCDNVTGFTSGKVTSVTINTAGNYSSAPTASFVGAARTTAVGTVVTSAITNGFNVTSITINNPGAGYGVAPTVLFAGGGTVNTTAVATATIGADGEQTGWGQACLRTNTQQQSGYALMIITLVILAAVVVLFIVRQLS